MKSSSALLIAAVVVVVLLVVYMAVKDPEWAHPRYWVMNFVENPWQVYGRSDGTFDAAAQTALRRAGRRRNATAADHFLSATIITRNILGQEPRVRTPEAAQIRRDLFGRAGEHYLGALAALDTRPRGATAAPGEATAPRVIDAALDFAFAGLAAFDDDVPAEVLTVLFDTTPVVAAAAKRREEILGGRVATAKAVAESAGGARGAAVAEYVRLATEHTSDGQNTHDVGVLSSLRAVVDRLRDDQRVVALPDPEDVERWLRDEGSALSEGRPEKVELALAVVARTRKQERVSALDITDEEALLRVFARADDPRNAEKRAAMRRMLFDNLVDCWEHDNIVCVNGRTDRILATLVLLDWDRRNWDVRRFEDHKNEIFKLAGDTIRDVARAAAASGDPGERAAGASYLATSAQEMRAVGEVPEAAAARLAAAMRERVGRAVDEYVAALSPGAVPQWQVDSVRAEALAAVG
ncbi:MAG: hypothetical protein WC700_10130 [Gemmatimonadaceae bacterium]|jgi:hypothetical protein